jgi:gluconate 2-dehydrogenase gamma chain
LDTKNTSRRQFLQAAGGAVGTGWLALHWSQIASAAEHARHAAEGKVDRSLRLLTPVQARDVDAIAAQIVPGGATPGAREAGVLFFVDHVHAGLFAPQAPAFLAGLAAFQAAFAQDHSGVQQFADLPEADQVTYLASIEQTPFFARMRFLTVLGLLALPSYGGNAGKAGWKLVGFDDRHVWEPPFGHYDRDYAGFEHYARKEPS